jgi:hypothetical protein
MDPAGKEMKMNGQMDASVDFDWVTQHTFPDTFAGDPLDMDWSGCGDHSCCSSFAWANLTPNQVAFLQAAHPGLHLGDALRMALGDLPRNWD